MFGLSGGAAAGGAARAADPALATPDTAKASALPSWFAPDPLTTDPQWGLLVFGGVSSGRSPLIKLMAMPWTGSYSALRGPMAIPRRAHAMLSMLCTEEMERRPHLSRWLAG